MQSYPSSKGKLGTFQIHFWGVKKMNSAIFVDDFLLAFFGYMLHEELLQLKSRRKVLIWPFRRSLVNYSVDFKRLNGMNEWMIMG